MDSKKYYEKIKQYLAYGSLRAIADRYYELRQSSKRPITNKSAYFIVQRFYYRIQVGDKLTNKNLEILPLFTEEAKINYDKVHPNVKIYPWEN